jgi:N-methylhydantoinase A
MTATKYKWPKHCAAKQDFPVSLSSLISLQMQELPRVNTVIANAYVQPQVADYLGRLVTRLRESEFARACELNKVQSFDMGGTTAKICLIEDGAPKTANTFEVARTYQFNKWSGMTVSTP